MRSTGEEILTRLDRIVELLEKSAKEREQFTRNYDEMGVKLIEMFGGMAGSLPSWRPGMPAPHEQVAVRYAMLVRECIGKRADEDGLYRVPGSGFVFTSCEERDKEAHKILHAYGQE